MEEEWIWSMLRDLSPHPSWSRSTTSLVQDRRHLPEHWLHALAGDLKFHRKRSTTTPISTAHKCDPHFRCVPLPTGAEFRGKRGSTNSGSISTHLPHLTAQCHGQVLRRMELFPPLNYRELSARSFVDPLSRVDSIRQWHYNRHPVSTRSITHALHEHSRRLHDDHLPCSGLLNRSARERQHPTCPRLTPPRRPKPMNAPTEREKPRRPFGGMAAFAT